MDRRLFTPERSAELMIPLSEEGLYPTITVDRWGDPIGIFEDWSDVKKVAASVFAQLTPEEREALPARAKDTESPDLDWLVGSMVFSENHATCDHCFNAIETDDPYPLFWFSQITGEYLCIDCLNSDKDWQQEYLVYCSEDWRGDNRGLEIARPAFANPLDLGWVRLNNWSDASEEDIAKYPSEVDHPDYMGDILTYGSEDLIKLLDRARIAIDDRLQLVAQYTKYGSGYIFYARFDPDQIDEEIANSREVLNYAMGLVFAQWNTLYYKSGRSR